MDWNRLLSRKKSEVVSRESRFKEVSDTLVYEMEKQLYTDIEEMSLNKTLIFIDLLNLLCSVRNKVSGRDWELVDERRIEVIETFREYIDTTELGDKIQDSWRTSQIAIQLDELV